MNVAIDTPSENVDLSGQTAIVTGGGRGLGRAYVLALAKAGATVIAAARSEAEVDETAQLANLSGGHAIRWSLDVTDRISVARMTQQIEESIGPIDLLVNNAGSFRALGTLSEVDPDDWWQEMEVNLLGPYLCTWAILPRMIQRRRGKIINVASAAGLQALETVSAYCAGKTALIRLTESIAIETEGHGIAVFALNPGNVRTAMTNYAAQSPEVGRRAPFVQQWFQSLFQEGLDTPIEQSVKLVLLLASGKADALSGCFLGVDDDIEALIANAEDINERQLNRLRLRD